MFEEYGLDRVADVKNVMPVLAWKLDNRRIIYDHEMLIRVTEIHVEAASFKQVCSEADNDPALIKEQIFSMINARGKLHNPFTNTGGLIAGTVEKIGKNHLKNQDVKKGDQVLVLISTAMIPLYLERIDSIDIVFGHIRVEGYAILFDNCSLIKRPKSVSMDLLMIAFEESASIYHVNRLAEKKKKVLIIGSNFITTLLYGYAVRKAIGKKGWVSALLHSGSESYRGIDGKRLDQCMGQVFDEIDFMNLANPLECAESILLQHPDGFDMSTNCSDVSGAETINVIVTKEKGDVFFSSLINDYNIALFLTEGMGKELKLLCADGYAKDYDQFMFCLLEELSETVNQVSRLLYQAEQRRNRQLKPEKSESAFVTPPEFEAVGFVVHSPEMRLVSKEIVKVAKYDCSVLITGETGVGKEKVVDLIHANSGRRLQRCVKVNCAAIPTNLMESEFFGYERGSFTGANMEGKLGYFEQAHKGILFLDEVAELPTEIQAKLLRVLQDNEFYRLGGQKPVRVDVRIVAASNKNLMNLVQKGNFREDLYYRLSVLMITIPPLRERKMDIVPLTEYFIDKYNEKYEMKKKVSDGGLQFLLEYHWPGNIRQLENVIQRLLINSNEGVISGVEVSREMYKDQIVGSPSVFLESDELNLKMYIEVQEKEILQKYLGKYGTTRRAADALHMTQAQLMRRKKKYGI